MDIGPVLRSLQRPALLRVESDMALAADVEAKVKAEQKGAPSSAFLKAPGPVVVAAQVRTSPADVLRELGVATTFLTRSPFVPVARLWAHVRYCATLRPGNNQFLALTPHAADDVVHHHKVAQSEQLGIGLALVAAQSALQLRHPDHVFHAVDIDVALKAGYIDGLPDKVESVREAKKRPDYFLIGRPRDGRHGSVKVVVLECKGTHGTRTDVVKQLGDACLQVRTVSIGNYRLYALMAGSRLAKTGITTYLLDPPGEDELWTGSDKEYQELLRGEPEDLDMEPDRLPVPAADPRPTSGEAPEDSATPASGQASTEPPEPPAHYEIPEDRRWWFAQVLTRSAAAAALLYAGDSHTAAEYATRRQRDYDPGMIPGLDELWEGTVDAQFRLPHGPTLDGTEYRMPLAGHKTLVMFCGLDRRLRTSLRDGNLPAYVRAAGNLRRWWLRQPRTRIPAEVFSAGDDGTALLLRVVDNSDLPSSRHSTRRTRSNMRRTRS